MLRTDNVVKIYDPKRPEVKALAGISLSFPEKGMVFVVGKSGSGKSTLMNILGCPDSPSSGEVYIDGRAASAMSAEERDDYRARKIGFIFQDFLLLDDMTSL